MTKSNKELVLYRLQRAHETLADARILADAGRWNPCVNRLYYACFYAVSVKYIPKILHKPTSLIAPESPSNL